MVMARLHLICGNCGCNDDWVWELQKEDREGENGKWEDSVYLWCRNCTSLHDLSNYAKQKHGVACMGKEG